MYEMPPRPAAQPVRGESDSGQQSLSLAQCQATVPLRATEPRCGTRGRDRRGVHSSHPGRRGGRCWPARVGMPLRRPPFASAARRSADRGGSADTSLTMLSGANPSQAGSPVLQRPEEHMERLKKRSSYRGHAAPSASRWAIFMGLQKQQHLPEQKQQLRAYRLRTGTPLARLAPTPPATPRPQAAPASPPLPLRRDSHDATPGGCRELRQQHRRRRDRQSWHC